MNIYDTKQIRCIKCGKFIGEIDYDAVIFVPKCGLCANPFPENDDKLFYFKSRVDNASKIVVIS